MKKIIVVTILLLIILSALGMATIPTEVSDRRIVLQKETPVKICLFNRDNFLISSIGWFISLFSPTCKPGIYTMEKKISPWSYWKRLITQEADIFPVTPGMTLAEITGKLSEILERDDDLLMAVKNRDIPLEGYILGGEYPLTETRVTSMIQRMFLISNEFITSLNASESDIIIASIIEKEGIPAYFPQLAAVYKNRYSQKMKLASLAVLRYRMGFVIQKDKLSRYKTPYNTFTTIGLPPTAICSPSKKALKAATGKAQWDYTSFNIGGDGRLTFK